MRIMTYNIRIAIQQGTEAIAHVINQAKPDIVALQEVGKHWNYGPPVGDTLAKLAKLTNLPHYQFAPALTLHPYPDEPQKTAQYGHGLLSRWPINHTHIQHLTITADEQRTLMFTTIQSPQTTLQILSTHLSHRDSDRPTQILELLEATQNLPNPHRPTVLLGDLNEHSNAPWIQTLQQTFSDADQTLNRPTFPADKPRFRLDYLFALNATWQNDTTVIDQPQASDHRPVIATLRIP